MRRRSRCWTSWARPATSLARRELALPCDTMSARCVHQTGRSNDPGRSRCTQVGAGAKAKIVINMVMGASVVTLDMLASAQMLLRSRERQSYHQVVD